MPLALDIGGTKIACAVVDGADVIHRQEVPTPKPSTPESVVAAVAGLVRAVEADADTGTPWGASSGPDSGWTTGADMGGNTGMGADTDMGAAIGIAVAGRVVNGTVTAVNPSTFPGWDAFPLRATLERLFSRPVHVMNDAHAATWGEYRHGSGVGADSGFMFVTVSTGVGAGVVLDGHLVTGPRGWAGHLGFVRVSGGNLEGTASGTALGRAAERLGGAGASAAWLIERSRDDAEAKRAVLHSAQLLRTALGDHALMLDIDRIAIGGGVGLNPAFMAALTSEALHPLLDIEVVPAVLGVDAGLIGVADVVAGGLGAGFRDPGTGGVGGTVV